MGWFSRRRKNASLIEIRRALQGIRVLDGREREHVYDLFQRYRAGGISRGELDQVIRRLKLNVEDSISPIEAKRVKRALRHLF